MIYRHLQATLWHTGTNPDTENMTQVTYPTNSLSAANSVMTARRVLFVIMTAARTSLHKNGQTQACVASVKFFFFCFWHSQTVLELSKAPAPGDACIILLWDVLRLYLI